MSVDRPTCYIVAGPNGAGKTTFAMKYLPEIAACRTFINADEIARGLSPLDIEAARLQASKIFLKAIAAKIDYRENFAFETTLSGKMYLPKIKIWRKNGWRVELFYLYLPSAESSAMRVKLRVAQGGHDIPLEAIYRRYPRSIANLFEYAGECDATYCLDNSGELVRPIFEQDRRGVNIICNDIYDAMQRMVQKND